MPDKNIHPDVKVFLTGNLYKDSKVARVLDQPVEMRTGVVIREGEYDEEWGPRWILRTENEEISMSEQNLSPIPVLDPKDTPRGFQVRFFRDLYDLDCSIQDSSLATEDAIWFGGTDENRMHLSRGQVFALLPLLQHFVNIGCLPE